MSRTPNRAEPALARLGCHRPRRPDPRGAFRKAGWNPARRVLRAKGDATPPDLRDSYAVKPVIGTAVTGDGVHRMPRT
jgi:hypothetical protein